MADKCSAAADTVLLQDFEILSTTRGGLSESSFDVYPEPFQSYMEESSGVVNRSFTGWEIVMEYCSGARHIGLLPVGTLSVENIESNSHWKTVVRNFWSPVYGAVLRVIAEELHIVEAYRSQRMISRYSVLAIQVLYLLVSLILLAKKYMQAVIQERIRVFQLFVKIPVACMKAMLEKKDRVGEDSDETSSSSDENAMEGATTDRVAEKHKHNSIGHNRRHRRKVKPSNGKSTLERELAGSKEMNARKYTLPLLVWAAFLLISGAIFTATYTARDIAYRSLVVCSLRAFSGESVRSLAIELASAGTWSTSFVSPRGADLASVEQDLRSQVSRFESLHEQLISSNEVSDEMAAAAADGIDYLPAAASLLLDPYQRKLMNDRQCLRTSTNSCLTTADEFYSEANVGLDRLINAYTLKSLAVIGSVTNETTASLLDSRPFRFVWEIGANDLRDGLNSSKRAVILSAGENSSIFDGILLAFLLLALIFYYWRGIRPFMKKTESETARAAAMIVFLPEIPELKAFLDRMKKIQKAKSHSTGNPLSSVRMVFRKVRKCCRRKGGREDLEDWMDHQITSSNSVANMKSFTKSAQDVSFAGQAPVGMRESKRRVSTGDLPYFQERTVGVSSVSAKLVGNDSSYDSGQHLNLPTKDAKHKDFISLKTVQKQPSSSDKRGREQNGASERVDAWEEIKRSSSFELSRDEDHTELLAPSGLGKEEKLAVEHGEFELDEEVAHFPSSSIVVGSQSTNM
uniref:Uncharacterized protein n=1 Tax=Palpitomonas bilix TaxID=652834 RepID=A0A7S3DIM2_9EUKA